MIKVLYLLRDDGDYGFVCAFDAAQENTDDWLEQLKEYYDGFGDIPVIRAFDDLTLVPSILTILDP